MNPTRLGAIPEEAKHKQQEDRSQSQSITSSTTAPVAPPGFPYRMQSYTFPLSFLNKEIIK
jgi:hypothetical protein